MPRGIPVRHGHALLHARSTDEAAELVTKLQAARPSHLNTSENILAVGTDLLSVAASASAAKALGTIVGSFPITGKATRTLGTALRVEQVRGQLQTASVKGEPLLKVLEWIAKAADAYRHLTGPLMDEAVATLRQTVVNGAFACEELAKAGKLNVVDPIAALDPWAVAACNPASQNDCLRSHHTAIVSQIATAPDPWSVWAQQRGTGAAAIKAHNTAPNKTYAKDFVPKAPDYKAAVATPDLDLYGAALAARVEALEKLNAKPAMPDADGSDEHSRGAMSDVLFRAQFDRLKGDVKVLQEYLEDGSSQGTSDKYDSLVHTVKLLNDKVEAFRSPPLGGLADM